MAALASLASSTLQPYFSLQIHPLSSIHIPKDKNLTGPLHQFLESQFAGHYSGDKVANPHPVSNGWARLGGGVYTRLSTQQELQAGKRFL